MVSTTGIGIAQELSDLMMGSIAELYYAIIKLTAFKFGNVAKCGNAGKTKSVH